MWLNVGNYLSLAGLKCVAIHAIHEIHAIYAMYAIHAMYAMHTIHAINAIHLISEYVNQLKIKIKLI